mgnify:CR=1 FL=1
MNGTDSTGSLRNKLLQLIPSGVGVYDVTETAVRKEYLNDGYYQMIGARRDERGQFDGTNTVNAIHPDDVRGLLAEARASIRERRMFSYRFRVLAGGGDYMWVAIRANHITLDDKTERFYAAYYDIDELMRTQEQLRENELMFRSLLKYSENVHFTYYPQRGFYEVMVMPEKLKALPKRMEDFPESFIEYTAMNKTDAAEYRRMVGEIDAGAQEAECTVRIRYLGKYIWYHVRLMNFLDSDGRPLRAIGNAVDIDSFKEAEKAFREEKLRMKSLQGGILAASCFNVSSDLNIDLNNDANLSYQDPQCKGIYEEAAAIDPEIVRQNPATLKVLLAAAEQIPDSRHRREFLLTCSHAGMMRLYESGRKEVALEYRRWTGRGLIWVSTRMALLPDPENGELLAFYYTSDINDRIIYRRITGQILYRNYETVSYYDMNSGKLYVKAPHDRAGISFSPVSYEDAVEAAVQKYVAPQEADEVREKFSIASITAALEREQVYSIYYEGLERDETLPGRPCKRMKSDLFYLDEHRDVIVILQTNVTAIYERERENREKMAAALAAAESANRAKTEFISRISHDIRTPISIISSMTDFAFADLGDVEKLKNDLARIKSADTFLLSLINDVLDISKIDSGKIELEPEPYPYEEYTANLRNMLEPMCESKGLTCCVERRNKVGTIVADKIRLNQISLNLISNAVKFTPPGGSVTYSSISEELPDGRILFGFEIKDTGIGMSEKFQQSMFQPFTQEYDNPDRPRGMTGTGLGLSIVKRMVDLMGGELVVKSELGRGTTMTCRIIFPNADKDPRWRGWSNASPRGGTAAGTLRGKVLLAEDNPINTEIAVRILEAFGLETDCAEDGAQAVEKFAAAPPGCYRAILMDIQMPVMNGYEATEKIRTLSRPDAKSVQIIAMTADAFADAAQRGREAGMDEYLVKPLDPVKIREVLSKSCGK